MSAVAREAEAIAALYRGAPAQSEAARGFVQPAAIAPDADRAP